MKDDERLPDSLSLAKDADLSYEELVALADQQEKSLGQLVLEDQAAQLDIPPEALLSTIQQRLTVMEKAAQWGMRYPFDRREEVRP